MIPSQRCSGKFEPRKSHLFGGLEMDCNLTSRIPGICPLPLSMLGSFGIRGCETAAPLKLPSRIACQPSALRYPWSQDRGPIEGTACRFWRTTQTPSIRGRETAAPLKLALRSAQPGVKVGIRGRETAAPLKRHSDPGTGFCAWAVSVVARPRPH